MAVMNRLTSVYLFEVDLLNVCRGMSRVITIIDSGEFFVDKSDESSFVPYIICLYLAQCDIRRVLVDLDPADIAWRLSHVASRRDGGLAASRG